MKNSIKTIVICPSCKQKTDQDDMTIYKGVEMCEGCAENTDFCSDPYNDITGRGFTNDCDYSG